MIFAVTCWGFLVWFCLGFLLVVFILFCLLALLLPPPHPLLFFSFSKQLAYLNSMVSGEAQWATLASFTLHYRTNCWINFVNSRHYNSHQAQHFFTVWRLYFLCIIILLRIQSVFQFSTLLKIFSYYKVNCKKRTFHALLLEDNGLYLICKFCHMPIRNIKSIRNIHQLTKHLLCLALVSFWKITKSI